MRSGVRLEGVSDPLPSPQAAEVPTMKARSSLLCVAVALLVIAAVPSHAQSPAAPAAPVIPPGPHHSIVPPVNPNPTPVDPKPKEDDLGQSLAIAFTLDGEAKSDEQVEMRPGQQLVMKLTGADLDKSPRPAQWTHNRTAVGFEPKTNAANEVCFTATAEESGAYLFTVAVNSVEPDKPPFVCSRWVVVSGKGPQPPPVVVVPDKPDDPDVPEPVDPTPSPSKVTAVCYVYEKDEGPIPNPILVALNRLNREQKIVATVFERDTTNGDGNVPSQYKPIADAARASGLPSLVVMAGETVVRTVKAPTTEDQVMEAAK